MSTDVTLHPPVGLLSVNVAEPSVIGTRHGRPIISAIGKRPVVSSTLRLGVLNLEGDRQADLLVHGGPDKAIYAYPSEHLAHWIDEFGVDPPDLSVQDDRYGPGTFGENLTTKDWLEDRVRLGDVWAWGDALLQVTQPRSPCYKLAIATGRPDLIKRFVASGRTGWYLRVLQPGLVPVAGPILVVGRQPGAPTVLMAYRGSS